MPGRENDQKKVKKSKLKGKISKTRVFCTESPGPGQGFWLSQNPGRAKSQLRPTFGPGLARPIWAWLGPASGFRP